MSPPSLLIDRSLNLNPENSTNLSFIKVRFKLENLNLTLKVLKGNKIINLTSHFYYNDNVLFDLNIHCLGVDIKSSSDSVRVVCYF